MPLQDPHAQATRLMAWHRVLRKDFEALAGRPFGRAVGNPDVADSLVEVERWLPWTEAVLDMYDGAAIWNRDEGWAPMGGLPDGAQYEVGLSKPALRVLGGLPTEDLDLLLPCIANLSVGPLPEGWACIQSGAYRVVYYVHESKVLVLLVGLHVRRAAPRPPAPCVN